MTKKKETESITIDTTSPIISQANQLKESQDALYNIVKALKENYQDDVNSINHNFQQTDIRFTEMERKLKDQQEVTWQMFNELHIREYELNNRLQYVEHEQKDLDERIKWCGVFILISSKSFASSKLNFPALIRSKSVIVA